MPELNLGQLCRIVRAEYLVDATAAHQGAGPAVHRHSRSSTPSRRLLGDALTDTLVPLTTKKDWTSDQEVRWCPGCGDYGILLAVQMLMPELGVKPENTRVRVGHRLLAAASRTT